MALNLVSVIVTSVFPVEGENGVGSIRQFNFSSVNALWHVFQAKIEGISPSASDIKTYYCWTISFLLKAIPVMTIAADSSLLGNNHRL
jgi:hypothetical protein